MTQIRVFSSGAWRALEVERPRDVRWIDRGTLLVGTREPSDDYRTRTRLLRLDVASGAATPLGGPAPWFDPAPDPAGELVALGLELDERGDGALEVRSLERFTEPLASRAQTLDRPRWSPSGARLVVAQTLADDAHAELSGPAIGGIALGFPRLFLLTRDLAGRTVRLHDGAPGGGAAAGGSIPLWWSEAGIFARQRGGLVRCDPAGEGCALVYALGEELGLSGGCALGDAEALLLVRAVAEDELPNEVHRVRLASGRVVGRWRAPPGHFVAALDWTD